MKYAKPALTFAEQVVLLERRGMQGDAQLMQQRLAHVSYYRLSGYWYPFRNQDDSFRPGTTFDTVWDRYVFDRRLRLLVIDAVERIEVAVRTQLSYHHAHAHGPFGYATEPRSLPKFPTDRRRDFLRRVTDEVKRSKEMFVEHFEKKYGDPHLPIWMATEVMTFGSVLSLYRGCSRQIKKAIASQTFGVPDEVLDSWLLCLNTVRNICAHHGRLWNRVLGTQPKIPRVERYPEWHVPVQVGGDRVFTMLTICSYSLQRIAPQSGWRRRVGALLDEFPAVPIRQMGFPDNWIASPAWGEGRI